MYMLAHTLCVNVYLNLNDVMGRSEMASQMQVFALALSLWNEVIQGLEETRRKLTQTVRENSRFSVCWSRVHLSRAPRL
jgi:hypothetical protein